MAEINISDLINDIKTAATDVLKKDVSTLRGFSKRQVKALAQHSALVAKGIADGSIGEDLQDYFLDTIEEMALNFVKALKGLLMITIEKVWNAIMGVISRAISTATGAIIPF